MKNNILIASAITTMFLQSCGSDKKKEAASENVSTELPVSQTQVASGDSIQMQSNIQPAAVTTTPTVVNPTATGATASTATGMNPAHGEPGHRCDIAVGAPLNSPLGKGPAGTTSSPTITPNISAPQTIQAAPPTGGTTLAGMNPPHGEPGHDCTIAVGAPLKK